MRHSQVHWHEGLFLRPQHFQAADRYWTELAQTSQKWDAPYGYGLHHIELSKEALANHQFEVHALEARLRDGTLVSLQAGQEPDRIDLKQQLTGAKVDLAEAFGSESTIRVYLAVPKLQLGRTNVGGNGHAERTRFVTFEQPTQDESLGGDDQPIEYKALNAELKLSTEDLTGFEVLPIAEIRRAGDEQAVPRLDPEYIPPVLNVAAWPELAVGIVRAVYDIIGQKIEVVSQQVLNRGTGFESREPGDLDRMLMLTQLNQAYAALGVLAFAQGVHPLLAYTELARVLGQLSVFGPERRVPEIPAYDHEDLARIFRYIKLKIEQLIGAVRDYEYEMRHFVGVGMGLQVTLEPKWFNRDWQWFIGVNQGDLTPQECRDLLSPGQLDWKFGSSRQVEILFQHRAEGLQLTPLDRAVRALPTKEDWLFYEVPRRDTPAWRDVQETMTLAVRLKDSLIVNRDRLQGERRLVVNYRGRQATLQFALFAVPTLA